MKQNKEKAEKISAMLSMLHLSFVNAAEQCDTLEGVMELVKGMRESAAIGLISELAMLGGADLPGSIEEFKGLCEEFRKEVEKHGTPKRFPDFWRN